MCRSPLAENCWQQRAISSAEQMRLSEHRPIGLGAGYQFRESGKTAFPHAPVFGDEEDVRSRSPPVPATCRSGWMDQDRQWAIPRQAVVDLEMAWQPARLEGRSFSIGNPVLVARAPDSHPIHRGWGPYREFDRGARGVWSSCPLPYRQEAPAWGERVGRSTVGSWAALEFGPRIALARDCPEIPRRDARDSETYPDPCPGGSFQGLRGGGRASEALRRPGKKP